MTDPFRPYRPWFYAAAAYNLLWGGAVVLLPTAFMRLAGLPPVGEVIPFVQVMGMMVGVYAYGYYLLARAPADTRASSGSVSPGRRWAQSVSSRPRSPAPCRGRSAGSACSTI